MLFFVSRLFFSWRTNESIVFGLLNEHGNGNRITKQIQFQLAMHTKDLDSSIRKLHSLGDAWTTQIYARCKRCGANVMRSNVKPFISICWVTIASVRYAVYLVHYLTKAYFSRTTNCFNSFLFCLFHSLHHFVCETHAFSSNCPTIFSISTLLDLTKIVFGNVSINKLLLLNNWPYQY